MEIESKKLNMLKTDDNKPNFKPLYAKHTKTIIIVISTQFIYLSPNLATYMKENLLYFYKQLLSTDFPQLHHISDLLIHT